MPSKSKELSNTPLQPPHYEPYDVSAIQALSMGVATAEQQKHALKYIVENVSRYYDISFRPGGEEGKRLTDFAEGMRFVGQQIVKLTKLDMSKLTKPKEKNNA